MRSYDWWHETHQAFHSSHIGIARLTWWNQSSSVKVLCAWDFPSLANYSSRSSHLEGYLSRDILQLRVPTPSIIMELAGHQSNRAIDSQEFPLFPGIQTGLVTPFPTNLGLVRKSVSALRWSQPRLSQSPVNGSLLEAWSWCDKTTYPVPCSNHQRHWISRT